MCLLNSGHVPQLKRNPCAQTILNGEVHNWYRLRLGYSDHLVADLLEDFGLKAKDRVLDPFCGSGTSLVECMKKGIDSTGIDANPASCFAATVKTNWLLRPETVLSLLDEVETSFERHPRRSSVLWTDPTFQDDRPACWNLWGNSSGSPGATSVDGWVTLCLFPAGCSGGEFCSLHSSTRSFWGASMGQGLKTFWGTWKQIASAIGTFLARVVLTVIYAALILPFGLITRLFSDSLRTKKRPTSWHDYPPVSNEMKRARRQG